MNESSPHLEHFPFLGRMEVLPEWEAAADRFLEQGGTVLVLGGPDTGKSTLSRYLVYRAFCAGKKTALVDLDLGQSHLGPPTALGLGLFPPRRPGDDSLTPEGLYFIGQTSPVGAILEVAVGCRVLVDQALARGAGGVVVNTSGFVQGPAAQKLKRAEGELLQPALILALQREQELQPLLRTLGGDEPKRTVQLPISSRVTAKSQEERRHYREKRFRRYFQRAHPLYLPWRRLVCEGLPWGQGEPLSAGALQRYGRDLGTPVLYGEFNGRHTVLLLAEAPGPPSPELPVHWLSWTGLQLRLVGLLDGARRTLALGLILPAAWDPETVALWTPWPRAAASQVRFLKLGKIRLSLEGQELTHV
jgi:polynucleotide 5'-hydroxyl-kinase GRC3/NOL9